MGAKLRARGGKNRSKSEETKIAYQLLESKDIDMYLFANSRTRTHKLQL